MLFMALFILLQQSLVMQQRPYVLQSLKYLLFDIVKVHSKSLLNTALEQSSYPLSVSAPILPSVLQWLSAPFRMFYDSDID